MTFDSISLDDLATCRTDPRLAKTLRSPDWIVCLECGRLLQKISIHHVRSHGLDAAEYRSKWGYNRGSGLSSENLSKKHRVIAREMGLSKIGRRNLKPFSKGHRGFGRRREGMLNNTGIHAGRSKPANRKLVDGRAVSDFEIAEARLRGNTLDSIAESTGLSQTAILFRLRRLKFPSHSGRRAAFEHGAPVTGQAIADLIDGSRITAHVLARMIGLSPSALYPHLRRLTKTIPFELARSLRAQRNSLPRRVPSEKGGRPTTLLPAERQGLPEKYRALHRDLVLLRRWVSERDGRFKDIELQCWVCDETRAGRIHTLLFWPEFFRWCRRISPSRTFLDTVRPQELAFDFLAEDFGVSPRAIARAVFGG
ncbi:MAG TPA: MucR family transcriptional regulator [Terriglobales bacterium]|nr:MucR family transcriptional regulator [Terriglobales bacterium]